MAKVNPAPLVIAVLEAAMVRAQLGGAYDLSQELQVFLDELAEKSEQATTGFTNVVTCLAIKGAFPLADVRYHQTQIQSQTDRPAGFNFRGVSEKAVAPWLGKNHFHTAKSGWQTRTFERPKPYMLDYDENIGDIKDSFLGVFDRVEMHKEDAATALAYLLADQLKKRELAKVDLVVPATEDILLIVELLQSHFFSKYKTKGASRLPVLALHATYEQMIQEVGRFHGMKLEPLHEHSAADAQTGAVGDVQVVRGDDTDFEAVEVKHDIPFTEAIAQAAAEKVAGKKLDRYYVLTTNSRCDTDRAIKEIVSRVRDLHHCQLIFNGVESSITYYLRLLADPRTVLPRYVEKLGKDKTVTHEHKMVWNRLASGGQGSKE